MLHLIFCITLVKHYVRKKHYFQFDFFGKFHLSLHNLSLNEYSCAMKSHFRKFGNQMSGSGNHLCNYASLLA